MTDSTPTFRAELVAALDVLTPQIGGLDDLTRSTISDESKKAISEQLVSRTRRRDLILALLVALENLEGDGYPVLENISVPPPLSAELAREIAFIVAAFGVFGVVVVEGVTQTYIDSLDASIKANTAKIAEVIKP